MSKNQKPRRVELKPAATKWLLKCDPTVRVRIKTALAALQDDPIPRGAKKLVGKDNFRLRVGDYRIIYEFRETQVLVLVVRIGHRREIYKKL
jgi:mRNA interferase RelE/StbE